MKLVFVLFLIVVLGGAGWLGYSYLPDLTTDEEPELDLGDIPPPTPPAIPFGVTIPKKIEVYDGIEISENETELDLSGRSLAGSLKAEIRLLTKLEELDISDNDFTGLPAEVGQLRNLRILNLSNNPLTGLPYELGQLQNLETLDLRGTNYAESDLEVIQSALASTTEILIDES